MIYRIEIKMEDLSNAKSLLAEVMIDECETACQFVYDTIIIDDDKTDLEFLEDEIVYLLNLNNIETDVKVLCCDCEGEGVQEIMTCYAQSNDCCGGCIEEVDCEECNGELWVYPNK